MPITLRTSSRTGTAPHHSTLRINKHGQKLTIFPFSTLLPPLRLQTTIGVNRAIATSLKTKAKVGRYFQWTKKLLISTPMGNGKKIDKVLLWNDLWIIQQGKEVFFTSSQKIQWQHFPIKVTDFYLDRETNNLMAITDKNEVMLFSLSYEFSFVHSRTSACKTGSGCHAPRNAVCVVGRTNSLQNR